MWFASTTSWHNRPEVSIEYPCMSRTYRLRRYKSKYARHYGNGRGYTLHRQTVYNVYSAIYAHAIIGVTCFFAPGTPLLTPYSEKYRYRSDPTYDINTHGRCIQEYIKLDGARYRSMIKWYHESSQHDRPVNYLSPEMQRLVPYQAMSIDTTLNHPYIRVRYKHGWRISKIQKSKSHDKLDARLRLSKAMKTKDYEGI